MLTLRSLARGGRGGARGGRGAGAGAGAAVIRSTRDNFFDAHVVPIFPYECAVIAPSGVAVFCGDSDGNVHVLR